MRSISFRSIVGCAIALAWACADPGEAARVTAIRYETPEFRVVARRGEIALTARGTVRSKHVTSQEFDRLVAPFESLTVQRALSAEAIASLAIEPHHVTLDAGTHATCQLRLHALADGGLAWRHGDRAYELSLSRQHVAALLATARSP